MDTETVLEQLLESGVLDGKESLTYTDNFLQKKEKWESSFGSGDEHTHSEIDSTVDSTAMRDRVKSVAANDPTFAAIYLSISEMVTGPSDLSLLAAAVVLDSLENRPNRTRGSPNGFLPISGESIQTYTSMYDRAIVFIWREACPTCETVRKDLEKIFTDGSQDIALLSVYGPACPKLLSTEYDVTGGPTTLFFQNEAVDSRTVGALQPEILQQEVEVLREASSPT